MKRYTPTKEFRRFVDESAAVLVRLFDLKSWSVTVRYVDSIPGRGRHAQGYAMQVFSDSRYMNVTIEISRNSQKMFERSDTDGVFQDLCHEFAHCLTDPYFDILEPFVGKRGAETLKVLEAVNERQTQSIANAVCASMRFNKKLK